MRKPLMVLAVAVAALFPSAGEDVYADGFTGEVVCVPAGHILQIRHDGEVTLVVLDGIRCPAVSSPRGNMARAFTLGWAHKREVAVEVLRRTQVLAYGSVRRDDGQSLADALLDANLAERDPMPAPDVPLAQSEYSSATWVAPFAENDGERRVSIEKDGTVNLYAKGNREKNLAFLNEMRRRREALEARRREQAERELLRRLDEERRARERAAYDLTIAQQRLALEEQALQNDRLRLYNECLAGAGRRSLHGCYGRRYCYFPWYDHPAWYTVWQVPPRTRIVRITGLSGTETVPSIPLPYPWGDPELYRIAQNATLSDDDDDTETDNDG